MKELDFIIRIFEASSGNANKMNFKFEKNTKNKLTNKGNANRMNFR